MTPEHFLAAVMAERARADELHPGTDDLPDSTDNPAARRTWETMARNTCDRAAKEGRLTLSQVFEEEVSEALVAAAEGDQEKLERELVQVAGVCLKWLETIARRRGGRA